MTTPKRLPALRPTRRRERLPGPGDGRAADRTLRLTVPRRVLRAAGLALLFAAALGSGVARAGRSPSETASPDLAPTMLMGGGSPAEGYYTFIDSNEPPNPPGVIPPEFDFDDIHFTGTPLGLTDDSCSLVPMDGEFGADDDEPPFVFTYHDIDHQQIFVCSNGLLSFGAPFTSFANACPPTATTPFGAILPYWDDLNPSTFGEVYWEVKGDFPMRTFIVQWEQVSRFAVSADTVIVQAKLFERSGDIIFEYFNVESGAPDPLAFKPGGELMVGSTAGHKVQRWSGGTFVGNHVRSRQTGLMNPGGMTVGDGTDGGPGDLDGDTFDDLFVSSFDTNEVIAYRGSTAVPGLLNQGLPISKFIPAGLGGLDGPRGLTYGPGNNLYVASFNTNQVLRYDGATGAFLGVFVAAGNGLSGPDDIVFGPDGNLYVSSHGSDRVLRYTAGGVFLDTFVAAGSGGLDGPRGLAFGHDGNLYVSSENTDEVLRYYGVSGAFAGDAVAAGMNGLDAPRGLRFGADGNGDGFADLYVSGFASDQVHRFDVGLQPTWSGAGLSDPRGMTLGPTGDILVANFGGNNILRFDQATGFFAGTLVPGGSAGLTGPTDIAVIGTDIYVTSSSNEVLRFNGTTGAPVGTGKFVWNPFPPFPDETGGLVGPRGIEVGPTGDLFVTTSTNVVKRYQGPSGGSPGSYLGDFITGLSSPVGILLRGGNFLIADRGTASVRSFSATTGAPAAGGVAPFTGGLDDPEHMLVDPASSALLVTDSATDAILAFDATGALLGDFILAGEGFLTEPSGIAVGASGWVLAASASISTMHQWRPLVVGPLGTGGDGSRGASASIGLDGPDAPNAGLGYVCNPGNTGYAPSVDAGLAVRFDAPPPPGADLEVLYKSTDMECYNEGDPITFEIKVTNNGRYNATGVTVEDQVPPEIIVTGSSATKGSYDSGTGIWTIGDLARDEMATLQIFGTIGPDTAADHGRFREEFVVDDEVPTGRLRKPIDAVIGPDGAMYVSSYDTDQILRYNRTTGAFIDIFVEDNPNTTVSESGGLNGPMGMEWGPDGLLYVTSFVNNVVLRYDGTGAFAGTFVDETSIPFPNGMKGPKDLTFGPGGELFISSSTNSQVRRYNGTTGVFEAIVAASNGDPAMPFPGSTLTLPNGLVFGRDLNGDTFDDLWVSSEGTSEVLVFSGNPAFPALLQAFVLGADGGLAGGSHITFGPEGDLYVSSAGGGAVLRYDGGDGGFHYAFVPPARGGLDSPQGLLFNDGRLLVVSAGTNQVLSYETTPSGDLVDTVATGLPALRAVRESDDRSLLYAGFRNPTNSTELIVRRYQNTDGGFVDDFIELDFIINTIIEVYDIALVRVDDDTERLYVAVRFGSGDNAILKFGGPTDMDDPGMFIGFTASSPFEVYTGLDVGPDNNLYVSVVSPFTSRVHRYTSDGASMGSFAAGSGLAQPWGLDFGEDGHLYVADSANDRVMQIDGASGGILNPNFIPSGSGGLDAPRGVRMGDDRQLYVASGNNDRVLRYDGMTGAYLPPTFASSGMDSPDKLAIAPNGDIYVASADNDRILRYDIGASFNQVLSQVSVDGLNCGRYLIFGPDDNLYVSSHHDDVVKRYDGTTGAFIDVFASHPLLDGPEDLIFGPDGNLYVASFFNNRVLKFNGSTGAFIQQVVPGPFAFIAEKQLDGPVGLAFGPEDDDLYVTNHTGNTITRYLGPGFGFLEGAPYTAPFVEVGGSPSLVAPRDFVFGPDLNGDVIGELFVSTPGGVMAFDGELGTYVSIFAQGNGLSGADGLQFGPDGNLYVVSRGTSNVLAFTPQAPPNGVGLFAGEFVEFDPNDEESDQLSDPYGLVFGPDGDLYVANCKGHNVLRYDGFIPNYAEISGQSVPAVSPSDPRSVNNIASTGVVVKGADLTITKTIDNRTPYEGDTVVYTIKAINLGPEPVTMASVDEVMDPGITIVDFSTDRGTYTPTSGTMGTWDIGALGVFTPSTQIGDMATLILTGTVDAGAAAVVDVITNTVTIMAPDQGDPDDDNNIDQEPAFLTFADLELTKTATPSQIREGEQVTFELTITNLGRNTAENVVVTDFLPGGLAFAGADPAAEYNPLLGRWTIGTLAYDEGTMTGDTRTLLITGTAVAGTGGMTLTNIATVTGTNLPDPFDENNPPNNNEATADVGILGADLQMLKTASPGPYVEGELITFTLTVNNLGPETAEAVRVVDRLPTGLAYVADDGGGAYDGSTGVWTVGDMLNGASESLVIFARLLPGFGGRTLVNRATATSTTGDIDRTNNTARVSIAAPSVDLHVTVIARPGPFPGPFQDPPRGPGSSSDGGILPSLDATPVLAVPATSEGIAPASEALAGVPGDASRTLPFTLGADGVAPLVLSASPAQIVAPPPPAFPFAGPAVAGHALFYEVRVLNEGSGIATNVVLTASLAVDVRYIADDNVPACVEAPTGMLTCQLGDIGPGQTRILVIQTEVSPDAFITRALAADELVLPFSARAVSDEPDTDSPDNLARQRTLLTELADLAVAKVSKPDDQVRAGEVFSYTIRVENLGPSSAHDVVVTDTILSDGVFQLVGPVTNSQDPARNDVCRLVPAPAPQSGQLIECRLQDRLEPVGSGLGSGRWTMQIEVTAAETQDINNSVRVVSADGGIHEAGTPDPDLRNNEARDRISVLDTADLGLTKTAVGGVHDPAACGVVTVTPNQVTAGDRVTYTLTATNIAPAPGAPGGSTATQVVIEDALPAGVEVVSVAAVGPNGAGGCSPGQPGNPASPPRCVIDELAVGEAATMTVVVTVDPDFVGSSDANRLHNGAGTWSDEIDPNRANNIAQATVVVGEVADLMAMKTSTPGAAAAGEALTFEVTVANNGPSAARNVIVRDQLPSEVTFVSARIEQLRGRESCTYSSGAHEVVCSLLDVPAGEPPMGQRRIFIDVTIRPDAGAGTATNTVTVLSEQTPDCNPDNNTDISAVSLVGELADLVIRKDSEPTKVFAGEQKRYHIEVDNRGPSDAQDVVVYDVLPDETVYEIDTNDPMCTQPSNLLAFRALLAGANEVPPVATEAMGLATFVLDTDTNRLTYAVQVTDINAITGAHLHQAPAGANGPVVAFLFDGTPPDFEPASPIVGEIDLDPALAAAIEADPAGFYVNVHTAANPAGEVRGQMAATINAPLRCVLGRMAAGSNRMFDIWALVRPETFSGTTITNVAIVTSPTEQVRPLTPTAQAPGVPGIYVMGSSNVDASKNLVLTEADLKVVKFGKNDGQVRAGEVLTYTVIIDNLGPSWAEEVSLKDVLQAGETFDLIDITSSRDAVCSTLANGITTTNQIAGTLWPPTLAPPPPFGVIAPTGVEGILQRLETDCTLTEGDDPATPDVNEAQLAVLTADGPPNSGRWILTMRVRARQAQDIDNVADVVSGIAEEPNLANNHAEVEHELTDVADLSVAKTATGEVQIDGQPGLIYDTTAPAPAFPQAPNYAASPDEVTAGRRIRYLLEIFNAGPSDAENTLVTDRLPPGVTLVPGSVIVTVDGRGVLPAGACQTGTPGDPLDRLTCGLGTLLGVEVGRDPAVRRAATIQFDVLVDPATPPNAVLENDADVTSDVFDPDNRNNHAFAQTAVTTRADMAAVKSAVGENVTGYSIALQQFIVEDLADQVTAGMLLRYEVTVQNAGPSDARNVQVLDVLPPTSQVQYLRTVGAHCRPDDVQANVLVCELGDMPAGARRTFEIFVRVDPAVPDGTVLVNGVQVLEGSSSPPFPPPPLFPPAAAFPPVLPITADPFAPDNFAVQNTVVNAVADVGGPGGGVGGGAVGGDDFIAKRDVPARPDLDMAFEPDRALAGNEHRYRIAFGNAGPSVATNVVITDTLDFKQAGIAGETFVRCEPLDPDDQVTCSYDPVANIVTVEEFLDHNEPIITGGSGTLPPGLGFDFYLITLVDSGYVLDAADVAPAGPFNSESGAVARNTVFIQTATTDFRQTNNRDTERTLIVAEADLAIGKTDLVGNFLTCDPVMRGGMITYTLTITNTGPSDAADVYVVDWLPEDVVVVDPARVDVAVGAGAVIQVRDDGRVTLRMGFDPNNEGNPELGRVNVASVITASITAMVRLDADCGETGNNRAFVETRRNDLDWPPVVVGPPQFAPLAPPRTPRTPTIDPDLTNNTTRETTTVECPAVKVNKTVSFDGTCPGRDFTVVNETAQPVTFCYEITNNGTTYLDTVRITDTLRLRSEPWPTVIFTDTITFGVDEKVPLAPGEVVTRSVSVPHVTRECGNVFNDVEVTANPVNSGRTDLPCLDDVRDTDTARIEVPCLGVDFRLQLPILNTDECTTWIQVQNVGDNPTIPMLVIWGEAGACPPQAAGPLKAECGGLLRPGSAWSFAFDQVPAGSNSAVVYSLSAEPVEDEPGQPVPFGLILCDEVFLNVIGDDLDWLIFDTAYRQRGSYNGRSFAEYQGEPLAVTVNRGCPDPVDPNRTVHAAYSGISSDIEGAYDPDFGGYTFYAPMIFAGRTDLNSRINIHNSGELCTSLEVWFKDQENCLRPVLGDVLSVSRGETVTFDPNTVVGPDWLGSAWIRSTQPLGIIVDTLGPNHFSAYAGVPGDVFALDFSLGDQINYAPLVYSEYQGWDAAITVQNLSGSMAAKVKVYFQDHAGGIITTLVDWICPRGSQTFFLPVIDDLPGGWVGSARIESQEWWSPGQPLVDPPRIQSVVVLDRWSDPARTERREALAYNAHTETIYEWQLGSGKGGLTTGSAVFSLPMVAKGNRGVTTEIAITNLVPKPGFTDFAIFLYDQNGLLDWVCEKLGEKQVEYIDLETWGWVNPSFLGSMVVSASYWDHHVFDDEGNHVRNLVGLGGIAVERIGRVRGSEDLPGDETKAYESFPLFDHFAPERLPNCPGLRQPTP